jgi:CspA family cold shock protein
MPMTGVVKKLVKDRGFGFVKSDDGKEFFFHTSGVQGAVPFDELKESQRVTFDATQGPKGPRAENVCATG